ncbi:hypothetical protein Scep_013516 [Stephania cephalantha]|uniref:Secreted protein n=1 Tax=Stephania cephalantha TaxID=152367 RepID=A0AAP0P7P6_9MAGN
MLFLALSCAAILSQCMHIAVTGFGQQGISSKKFLSHSNFFCLVKAMNSDSMVDRAIHVCFVDFQEIVLLHPM